MPSSFTNILYVVNVRGGLGDDIFISEALADTVGGQTAKLYGEEGNDVIYGIHNLSAASFIKGGAGDDKLTSGEGHTVPHAIYGNDGNDIIYGAESGLGEMLYGDNALGDLNSTENGIAVQGGNDRIYGSNNLTNGQFIAGGTYDDMIWSGSNIGVSVQIYGDNPVNTGDPADTYDPDGLNKNDGDDVIDVGDNNETVAVQGQGGNDKIIGGYGSA